jgi:hypothetical protein
MSQVFYYTKEIYKKTFFYFNSLRDLEKLIIS